jgi:hypothetical protein
MIDVCWRVDYSSGIVCRAVSDIFDHVQSSRRSGTEVNVSISFLEVIPSACARLTPRVTLCMTRDCDADLHGAHHRLAFALEHRKAEHPRGSGQGTVCGEPVAGESHCC